MSEEEKRAIELLKQEPDFSLSYYKREHAIDIVLNLIDKQQKEIEEKNIAINKMSKDISRQLEEIEEKSTIIMAGAEKVKRLEKEIKKYKRYFKLAISDLQSEGYMQMPYKNIEKYYSKREDIV